MRKFLSLLLVLILFSCEHEDRKSDIQSYILSGKWNWIESSGGFAGITYTPESTGEKIIIEFTSGSEYREYRNGELRLEDNYRIHGDTVIFKSILRKTYNIKGNMLILDEGCCDLFVHKYKRIGYPYLFKFN